MRSLNWYLQRLQERYSSGRVPGHQRRLDTPSTFETPETDPTKGGAGEDRRTDGEAKDDDDADSVATGSSVDPLLEGNRPKESLDKFMAKHTSEDNESFIELQEEEYKVTALATQNLGPITHYNDVICQSFG